MGEDSFGEAAVKPISFVRSFDYCSHSHMMPD